MIGPKVTKILQHYNGDWDVPSKDSPPVTWVERELVDCVLELASMIEALSNRVYEMSGDVSALDHTVFRGE